MLYEQWDVETPSKPTQVNIGSKFDRSAYMLIFNRAVCRLAYLEK